MRIIKLALGALALAVGLGGAAQAETLRIGVEGAYPPFSWKEPDGTLKGFDIDIAWALCEEMGRDCELVEQDWDGMIPALLEKRYDAILASMSITEERKQRVDFTKRYYLSPAQFFARKGSGLTDTPEAMAGKAVGVQRATIHQHYMEERFPEADLRLYATQDEVYLDLINGRLDAGMAESIAVQEGFLKTDQGRDFEFVGETHYDIEIHGEGVGIALRKGEDALREAFNDAIRAIRANGTYDEIRRRYFDFDIYGAES